MKKSNLILIALAIGLNSCSKETTFKNHIDGETWKVTNVDIYQSIEVINNGTTTSKAEQNFSTPASATYRFEKDGTGKYTESNTSSSFKWSVSDTQIFIDYETKQDEQYEVVDDSSTKQKWNASLKMEITILNTTTKTNQSGTLSLEKI